MKKDASVFIEHILDSIKNIEAFMKGVTKQSFFRNKEKQSAVIRQIEIIGEAVKNLPHDFKNTHPNVLWRDIAGMRDKLMHHYFGVDLNTVLKVIKQDLPDLKTKILEINAALKEEKRKEN